VVDVCLLTKFEGSLQSLHEEKDNARNTLETTATRMLHPRNEMNVAKPPSLLSTSPFICVLVCHAALDDQLHHAGRCCVDKIKGTQ